MALDFGKNNRSIAFNPTSAFPLDARSYFESYQLAAAAAASAEPASSTNTQYYFGQEIVVVENNVASFYIIQPNKTLSEVGGKVEINPNVFEYINGKLNLFGFARLKFSFFGVLFQDYPFLFPSVFIPIIPHRHVKSSQRVSVKSSSISSLFGAI